MINLEVKICLSQCLSPIYILMDNRSAKRNVEEPIVKSSAHAAMASSPKSTSTTQVSQKEEATSVCLYLYSALIFFYSIIFSK